ncbi:MAG: hypothetical protein ACRDRL_11315, partial [Sciscionella sp.]
MKYTPWALAEVARVSLVHGNEHRHAATERDLIECCAAFGALTDPDLLAGHSDAFERFMLRISSEQLSHQAPPRDELARSIALFEQTSTARRLKVITGDWDIDLFHCSISEYVAAAFLLWAGSVPKAGFFDFNWIDNNDFHHLLEQFSMDRIRQVAETHYIADRDEIRRRQALISDAAHPDLRHFRFNPLDARPVVRGMADPLLIPACGLLVRKVSQLGIFYTAMERYGANFSTDLGHLFEAYVGRHLDVVTSAKVYPSFKYKVGRDRIDAVDWIVVFADVTLLVEVKAARPTEAVRIGGPGAPAALKQSLAHGFEQIDRDARAIRAQHEAFSFIAQDKPIIGL